VAVVGEIVIDASAALAFVRKEPGGARAPSFLAVGIMSAVNHAEVAQRFWRENVDPRPYLDELSNIGLLVVATERETAEIAGEIIRQTSPFGVSLADRICLAEAIRRKLPVLTADRPWAKLGLSIDVHQLR
jgi:PIN domain nuclease of toxin-antitoxin system